jgi:hypothetical protein
MRNRGAIITASKCSAALHLIHVDTLVLTIMTMQLPLHFACCRYMS